MRGADVVFAGGTVAVAAWAGSGLGGVVGAVIGGLVGAAVGFVVAAAGIRFVVAAPVVVGAVAGGILGRSIVHTLCLPGDCPGAETTAALLTGLGGFIGVGLVAALVTRSFEEYRESRAESPEPRENPEPGAQNPDDLGSV